MLDAILPIGGALAILIGLIALARGGGPIIVVPRGGGYSASQPFDYSQLPQGATQETPDDHTDV